MRPVLGRRPWARRATAHRCPAPMTPMPGRPTASPACLRRGRDEKVVLWLQNSHAVPIPAGTVALDRMGAERPVRVEPASRPVRHGRAGRRRFPAGSALAGAGRNPNRAACGAPALRGDAERPRAHRPCERGAGQSSSRSRHSVAAAGDGTRLHPALPDPASRALPVRCSSRRRCRRRRPTCRSGWMCLPRTA